MKHLIEYFVLAVIVWYSFGMNHADTPSTCLCSNHIVGEATPGGIRARVEMVPATMQLIYHERHYDSLVYSEALAQQQQQVLHIDSLTLSSMAECRLLVMYCTLLKTIMAMTFFIGIVCKICEDVIVEYEVNSAFLCRLKNELFYLGDWRDARFALFIAMRRALARMSISFAYSMLPEVYTKFSWIRLTKYQCHRLFILSGGQGSRRDVSHQHDVHMQRKAASSVVWNKWMFFFNSSNISTFCGSRNAWSCK